MNKIFLGDCRYHLPDIPSECADVVFTDPPFNINLVPQRKTHGKIANDDLTPEDFQALILQTFAHCYRILKPNTVAWICCNWQCIGYFDQWLEMAGFEIKNCVVWVKNNFGLGNHLRPQHEFILLAFKGEPPVPKDAKNKSNVWYFDRLIETVHPNEKPIDLIQEALKLYNKEGDILLDPFAGSFSSCLAAKMLGMQYIGMEAKPEFFFVGQSRLEHGTTITQNLKGKTVSRIEGVPLLEIMGLYERMDR